jgi:Rha family phage regulatory protein|tara:strand:+ start:510 stop:977 length:468 start_codon:yes stop_codon:yes gene_type:complete
MQLVKQSDGQLMTTSKIVSDVFGKVHRDVVRSIKELKCSDEFRVRNFAQSYYVSPQNKKLQCYEMTRDGFSILCMGFTGNKAMEWKEKYINAFNEMESGLLLIDKRMQILMTEQGDLKKAGVKWSAIGREIRSRKQIHLIKTSQLLDDVQMKLEY